MHVDYGDLESEDSSQSEAHDNLKPQLLAGVMLFHEDPIAFRTKIAGMLFNSRLPDRIYASVMLMAMAPFLKQDMALALTAALREEPIPPDQLDLDNPDDQLAALGISTRSIACRALGVMRERGGSALERLYQLLERAIEMGPVHTAVAAESMGVAAAEVADAIAQIEGPTAAPRLLPIFNEVFINSQKRGRDDAILSFALHGVGFLRRSGRPLLHWLNWMDREQDLEIRFQVGCASVRVRDGEHGLDSTIGLPIREFESVFNHLMDRSADTITVAEAAEVCASLRSANIITPPKLDALRIRVDELCNHYVPSVYVAARRARELLG